MTRLTLAVLLAISTALAAQDSTDPEQIVQRRQRDAESLVRLWLASDDLRFVAWGASLAAREQVVAARPALTALVETHATSPQRMTRDERYVQLAMLDGLVQLGGTISPDAAALLYPDYPVQTILLLARLPVSASTRVLLNIVKEDTQRGGTWLAAANLLARNHAPGFAAWALSQLTIHVDVRVTDAASPSVPGRGVGVSCSGGLFEEAARAGWPSVASYQVSARGTTPLIDGADDTYYTRSVGTPRVGASTGDVPCASPYRDRDHLLARLLTRTAATTALESHADGTIRFRSASQYRIELLAIVDRQRAAIDAMRSRFTAMGLLTDAETATATPALEVKITDARGHREPRLPAVTHKDPHVAIG